MKDHPEWVGETGLRPGDSMQHWLGLNQKRNFIGVNRQRTARIRKKMDARLAFNYLK